MRYRQQKPDHICLTPLQAFLIGVGGGALCLFAGWCAWGIGSYIFHAIQ